MSGLEDAFAAAWKTSGCGRLITEYQFAPGRKYKFDFASTEAMVAVELEGGIFGKQGKRCQTCKQVSAGRHSRPMGFHEDCEKYNLAASLGWVVVRFTTKHLKEKPVQCVELVSKLIADRSSKDVNNG